MSARIHQLLFAIGEIVVVKKTGIRGVIIEVDEIFKGSPSWFTDMKLNPTLRTCPWYHIMLENGDECVYVSETHLERGSNKEPVSNNLLLLHFQGYENGKYKRLSH